MAWKFYGRSTELATIADILSRNRWFFAKMTGRRRVGKTELIRQAMGRSPRPVFYVQIPDSAPAGVLTAFHDALDIFAPIGDAIGRPYSLADLAKAIGSLARSGVVVVLDEFQYFHRPALREFPSLLQAVVDDLGRPDAGVTGGLIVLGSIHTEMEFLLSDQRAPLFQRVTDSIQLDHLDISSVLAILREHSDASPARLLFLWNLFEGVPKFYKDCFEQAVLGGSRRDVLEAMFFRSSAPLRDEAENWFLHELRGKSDVILKFVARHPGCSNGDIVAHLKQLQASEGEQIGGYLQTLVTKYRLLARRDPIFGKQKHGRFYVVDNFLRSWLAAIAKAVAPIDFRPLAGLLAQADAGLENAEGHGLEQLVARLYQERSRKGLPGFALTHRIEGYWDAAGTEIDLVAVDDDRQTIRYGTCKRAASDLVASLGPTEGHIARFRALKPAYAAYRTERVAITVTLDAPTRAAITARGWLAEDLGDLTRDL